MMRGLFFYIVILVLVIGGVATYVNQRYGAKFAAKEWIEEYKTLQMSTIYSEHEKYYPKPERKNIKFPGKIRSYNLIGEEFQPFYFKWEPKKKMPLPEAYLTYRLTFETSDMYGNRTVEYKFIMENKSPDAPFKLEWVVAEIKEIRKRL